MQIHNNIFPTFPALHREIGDLKSHDFTNVMNFMRFCPWHRDSLLIVIRVCKKIFYIIDPKDRSRFYFSGDREGTCGALKLEKEIQNLTAEGRNHLVVTVNDGKKVKTAWTQKFGVCDINFEFVHQFRTEWKNSMQQFSRSRSWNIQVNLY